MGRLLDHIQSPEFAVEQEKQDKERRDQIAKDAELRAQSEKIRDDNTIVDSLENLKNDGWFKSDRKILHSGTAYHHVLEHAVMPYALVYYFGDYSVPKDTDLVEWQKCELVEVSRFKIELLKNRTDKP